MGPKIFFIGCTGYIGGDVLAEVAQALPDIEISCLVRDSDKGAQVASQYPKAKLIYGSLDDSQTLENEAKDADIVLNCASADHAEAAKALIRGLSTRTEEDPAYLIHTSGTGILMFKDTEINAYGESSSKVYDDWDGISEVISLPDHASHRLVDKIVIEADSPGLRTAIVSPPTIYGVGRGPVNRRGHQLYELARCTLERKKGLQVGAGKAYWTNIHVHDMSKCYLGLVRAALQKSEEATWGEQGYYFTENGEHVWGDTSSKVAKEALRQGLIPSDEVVSIDSSEANQLTSAGAKLWGQNSRGKAIRARKLLGWKPKECTFEEEIPHAVTSEAEKLGLIKGHAAKVSR